MQAGWLNGRICPDHYLPRDFADVADEVLRQDLQQRVQLGPMVKIYLDHVSLESDAPNSVRIQAEREQVPPEHAPLLHSANTKS